MSGGIQSNLNTVAGSPLLRRRAGLASPHRLARHTNTDAKGRGRATVDAGRVWAVVGNVNGPTTATLHRGRCARVASLGGHGVFLARWAALGCDATSRQSSTTKGETARQPSPRWFSSSQSFRVIKPSHKQGVTVVQVLFGNPQQTGAVVPFLCRRPAPHGNQYVTQSPRKIGVCAFHRSSSVSRSGLEALH